MKKRNQKAVLRSVTDYFLDSHDFNGITYSRLLDRTKLGHEDLVTALESLVQDELVGVQYSDVEINPHIIRTHFEKTPTQVEKLATEALLSSCLYPRPRHLNSVVDKSHYDGEPYKLAIALGEPQLTPRSFDISVLEFYRNDPRYAYRCSDISGSISVKSDHYESDQMQESDQVLLDTFGFSYDDNMNRAVAVYIRYLADLSKEHQHIWKAKELVGSYKLHPDYFRSSIVGEFPERTPIFDAILAEMRIINKMSEAMGRPKLFRNDFGEYGRDKPLQFGFLIRPTLKEYNDFILLLDQMLSENVNHSFFPADVPRLSEQLIEEGKVSVRAKGSLQILDEWVRKYFRTNDWEPWNESIASLKKVRKLRQSPAHKINQNIFDQEYFRQQRELIIETYTAVRTLRLLLQNHPAVHSSNIEVPSWLREGRIWTY